MPSKQSLKVNLVNEKLDLILLKKMIEEDPDTADALSDFLDNIQATYDKAAAEADTDETAEKICTAIAKGVPDIVKNILEATKAFKKGDVMNGTASVMNMCAAAAPMFGSIMAAAGGAIALAGPVGAVVGMVFGLVGQILAFFGPKQESVIDQVEELLLRLQADHELQDIQTAHMECHNFSRSLKAGARELTKRRRDPKSPGGKGWLPSLLKKPLMTDGDVDVLVQKVNSFADLARSHNPIEGNAIDHLWHVKNWLDKPENQDQEKWPEVLAVWCKAYSEMMSAYLTFFGICRSADLRKRLAEVTTLLPGSLITDDKRTKLKDCVESLHTLEDTKRVQLETCNDTALAFLREVKPVALNRGLFAIADRGDESKDGDMKLGTGRNILNEDKFGQVYQHCHNMVITPPPSGANNPKARYDAWLADYALVAQKITHSGLDVATRKMTNPPGGDLNFAADAPERSFDRLPIYHFTDWYPVPVPGAAGKYTFYGTVIQHDGGALESWAWDSSTLAFTRNAFKRFWGLPMTQVRGTAKPALVAQDPDRSEEIDKLVESGPILYVTVKDSHEIFVVAANETILGTIPIPFGTYTGVAVDPEYVWVCGQDGFACATHASVISCLGKHRPMPWWLGNGKDKNLAPVLDLSPCEDGTMLVSTPSRLFMSEYRVDLKTPDLPEAKRVIIEDWKPLGRGGGAGIVQKLPIFGAPLLLSLMSDLAPKRPASAPAPAPAA